MNRVKIGDSAPSFQLLSSEGKIFCLDNYIGKYNVVLIFYPRDYSYVCTQQLCSFRDRLEFFDESETKLVGISEQSTDKHSQFKAEYRLNFTLLSDSDNEVRQLYGVKRILLGLLPQRITFIIDKNGKIVHIFKSQVDGRAHVAEALRVIKRL